MENFPTKVEEGLSNHVEGAALEKLCSRVLSIISRNCVIFHGKNMGNLITRMVRMEISWRQCGE